MLPGFICKHLTRPGTVGKPVLLIVHEAPVDDTDTGLGMYCGAVQHEDNELLQVNLERVALVDPTVREILATLPQGQQATRTATGQPWLIEAVPEDDDQAAA